jgi:hypothetical protein
LKSTDYLNIDISSFLKFADYFFDGLFVDWTVQFRINDALSKAVDTKNRVSSVVRTLEVREEAVTGEIRTLESRISDFIEEARI